jgi:hypothetical protein
MDFLGFPQFQAVKRAARPETNHERTLSVPVVFRNHLI